MLRITVGNSYSNVKDISTDLYTKLRKVLSYSPDSKTAYFKGGYIRPSYLLDKRGNFPTGLLNRVLEFCSKNGIVPIIEDIRKIKRHKLSKTFRVDWAKHGIKPYKEQIKAAESAMKHKRGIISSPTGTGKSLMIALTIERLQCRTLIVTPSVELKKQLSKVMSDLFGKIRVGKNKDIYIENVQALNPKKIQEGYDAIIIDEFHHSGAKTYRILNKYAWQNIYYRFGFTATPYRNNDNEKILLESVLSDIIYSISIKSAINLGYIVPVEAYYFDVEKQASNAYTWSQVYSELVVNNNLRNEMISGLLYHLRHHNIPTLCLVKEIAHGEILNNLTGIPFANGKDENTRKYIFEFNAGRIKCLIGTTGIIGEGIDTKPAEYIVVAGLGKAKSAFIQQIGRGVRKHPGKESCKIILFKDSSHRFTLRHFNAQKKILLEEFRIKPIRL